PRARRLPGGGGPPRGLGRRQGGQKQEREEEGAPDAAPRGHAGADGRVLHKRSAAGVESSNPFKVRYIMHFIPGPESRPDNGSWFHALRLAPHDGPPRRELRGPRRQRGG